MQVTDRIQAIEQRAQGINLTLARVCRSASVDYSQVWRWRNGESRPLLHNFEAVTSKLESKLAELEAEMRSRLQKAS